ncbi:cytochrome b5-like heme/steroid binding domain-containing protein [Kockovaella imperatae]|uniref:Cytochrome b5-like heme/steroid binding domain-containing protein n=1 Tax=Kockovaella imperatae TaxID=4999 RepID=A0A1Y1UBW2_9TREE|nr:cytochrome b5-like heme/steroid binding domain-containing protein [Kockovaella imperatae]ORX35024.1 cytochrome b5-like heme/steroid binding domain-containing protein [Kockovaella imperatae]
MDAPDVYTNTDEDYLAGTRKRSRPGTDPSDKHYEQVTDGAGRKVSNKPPNKPFLKAKAQREAHAARVADDAKRRAGQNPSSIPWGTIMLVFMFLPLLSQFSTGSWTFNLSPHIVPPIQKYWKTSPFNPNKIKLRQFTPERLARHDGSNPNLPLYLAIDGQVFDVSSNRRVYGPGGSYNFMTGKDASRAFITGCFETHQTHDLRGLSVEELKALDHWKSFFADHKSYALVGHVLNPDIDPSTPIPPPCDQDEQPGGTAPGSSHAGPHGPQVRPAPAQSPVEARPQAKGKAKGEL